MSLVPSGLEEEEAYEEEEEAEDGWRLGGVWGWDQGIDWVSSHIH